MKKSRCATRMLLCIASLGTLTALAACGQAGHEDIDMIIYSDDAYYTDVAIPPTIEPIKTSDSDDADEIITVLTNEDLSVLRANLFFGGGPGLAGGGDEMIWYHFIFDGWRIGSAINMVFVDYVGLDVVNSWVDRTSAQRDWRIPGILHFIEYFNLTPQDVIRIQESAFGRTMEEMDSLITRARIIREVTTPMSGDEIRAARSAGYFNIHGLGNVCIEEFSNIGIWEHHVFSTDDIYALFSNDINLIWAAFPGFGVLHNGNAYSPEWILNNTERAIYGEPIPLGDIERIAGIANLHPILDEITATVTTTLQTATATLATPTPFTLNFNLNLEQNGITTFTDINPSSIAPITLNAWDEILNTLATRHNAFPVAGPTKPGYQFAGWYLDNNFTTPITETFRMPARNTTLYARWQPLERN